MNTKARTWLLFLLLIGIVAIVCTAAGCWVGGTGTQQRLGTESVIQGTPVTLRSGRRIRLYIGSRVQGEPAFTMIAGRVYRGNRTAGPMLTVEDNRVYAGDTAGAILYTFSDDRVFEGDGTSGPVQFRQLGDRVYLGPVPEGPVFYTFAGTKVYRGDPTGGRVLAISNVMLNDPAVMKLVSILVYMETLE